MKKILITTLIILVVIATAGNFLSVNAEDLCTLNITLQNANIAEGQKQVVIQINLSSYSGAGDLGYQGTLQYDKNIFESVTMTSLNDWEDIDYEDSTGTFLSTTKNAKAGTTIAEITLTIKDGVTAQNTEVTISNLMFSDGETSATFNKTFTLDFAQNAPTEQPDDNEPDVEQPDDNTPDEEQPNDNQPNEDIPNTDDEQQPNDNNQEETPSGNNQNTTANVIQNTQTNSNDTIIIEGGTNEDLTTADGKIPQTGGVSTLIVVGVIAVIGIVCYIRYRTIQVK